MFHELLSRDRGEVCATGQPQGGWTQGVLEQYVAGADTRGRPEGRSYPRSQQAIHEISGLGGYSPLANLNVVLSLGAVWSDGHGNARSESPFFTLTLHPHAEENASECARCVRAQARTG